MRIGSICLRFVTRMVKPATIDWGRAMESGFLICTISKQLPPKQERPAEGTILATTAREIIGEVCDIVLSRLLMFPGKLQPKKILGLIFPYFRISFQECWISLTSVVRAFIWFVIIFQRLSD